MALSTRRKANHPRRAHSPRSRRERQSDVLWIFGIHTVASALANPDRKILRLLVTDNARRRLPDLSSASFPIEPTTPKALGRLLGDEAVHQGVAAEVEPLSAPSLEALPADARLLLFLDQVTDPHNVGAILRSAAAMAADAVIVTRRYSPVETGVLAKAASGALDLVPMISVGNLANALEQVGALGFHRIGLASEGTERLENALSAERLALVLGAEGKGLRQRTRDTCDVLCRLELAGPVASLNVSNAAAIALYLARSQIGDA